MDTKKEESVEAPQGGALAWVKAALDGQNENDDLREQLKEKDDLLVHWIKEAVDRANRVAELEATVERGKAGLRHWIQVTGTYIEKCADAETKLKKAEERMDIQYQNFCQEIKECTDKLARARRPLFNPQLIEDIRLMCTNADLVGDEYKAQDRVRNWLDEMEKIQEKDGHVS